MRVVCVFIHIEDWSPQCTYRDKDKRINSLRFWWIPVIYHLVIFTNRLNERMNTTSTFVAWCCSTASMCVVSHHSQIVHLQDDSSIVWKKTNHHNAPLVRPPPSVSGWLFELVGWCLMVYHQQRRERPFCLEPRLSQGGWERRGEKRREEKKEGRIKGVGIGYYHNARQPYLYFF